MVSCLGRQDFEIIFSFAPTAKTYYPQFLSPLSLTLPCPGTGRAVVKIGHSNLWPGSKELMCTGCFSADAYRRSSNASHIPTNKTVLGIKRKILIRILTYVKEYKNKLLAHRVLKSSDMTWTSIFTKQQFII